ncbi:MAG: hypothetical protein R6V58_06320 [Planctomycetota bacterium]
MPGRTDVRVLVCLGAVAASAMLAGCQVGPTVEAERDPAPDGPPPVEVEFHPLVVPRDAERTLPRWFGLYYGILAHSNGKVYVGTNYHVARLVEFDPRTGKVRVAAVMSSRALQGGGPKLENPTLRGDLATGRYPMDRWAYAQHKIHAQLHEGRDGRVYGATHTHVEDANRTQKYPGGHWFAYDPKTDETEDLGWVRRHEGIITCCMDRRRNVLYGISWPTGYLFACKPGENLYYKRLRILGLASSYLDCSARYVECVKDGRVYVPDGATGRIRVFDPVTGRLRQVRGLRTPVSPEAEAAARGATRLRPTRHWRNWWISGTRSPDGMHIFLTSQRGNRLVEIDATRGEWGVAIDHGPLKKTAKERWGGHWSDLMVFGPDGLLYHTVDRHLLSFDPESGRVLDWGPLVLKSKPTVRLGVGAGSLGRDGKIYCTTRRGRRKGIGVIDLAALEGRTPRLVRVSPRREIRPVGGE